MYASCPPPNPNDFTYLIAAVAIATYNVYRTHVLTYLNKK